MKMFDDPEWNFMWATRIMALAVLVLIFKIAVKHFWGIQL